MTAGDLHNTRLPAPVIGYNHFVSAVTEERQPAAPQEETTAQRRARLTTPPLEEGLADVSNPCREGRHYRCTGKLAAQQLRHGNRYIRCKCPFCDHPPIRTMPLKR